MAKRPFAAFDVDGTVIRWQLYHAIADEMAYRGIVSSEAFQPVREARMTWKNRGGNDSFIAYENAMITLVEQALKGLSVTEFETICRTVIAEYKDQVYTYTRDLIADLKRQNYLLFAISASQSQIISLFAAHYGFDDFGGSEYEVVNGRFTGKMAHLLKSDKKPEYLQTLVVRHDVTWEGSLAVGDSESDIPMLSTVEQPIAFNPTKALFEHARAQGWKIVVERKNTVYELESKDGSYLLA